MGFVRVATLDSNVHAKELSRIIFYSISFDECMNRISQNEQMDFIIRYWDGHATAVDLLTHFKQGISRLDPKRRLQVSMDGPNVNWKFYTDLTKERNF